MNAKKRTVLLTAFCASIVFPSARAQSNPCAAQAGETTVFFHLRDKTGAFVSSAKQQDFAIFQNGVRLNPNSVEPAINLPLNVGIILDASGTRRGQFPGAEQKPIEDFLLALETRKAQAFISWFGEKIARTDVAGAGALVPYVGTALERYYGPSAVYQALGSAIDRFSHLQGRRHLVLITDTVDTQTEGGSSVRRKELSKIAEKLSRERITIHALLLPIVDGNSSKPYQKDFDDFLRRYGHISYRIKRPEDFTARLREIMTAIDSTYCARLPIVTPVRKLEIKHVSNRFSTYVTSDIPN